MAPSPGGARTDEPLSAVGRLPIAASKTSERRSVLLEIRIPAVEKKHASKASVGLGVPSGPLLFEGRLCPTSGRPAPGALESSHQDGAKGEIPRVRSLGNMVSMAAENRVFAIFAFL